MAEINKKFFSQLLWEYWDSAVTCNRMIVNLSFHKDQYSNGATYLQFSLRNKIQYSNCSLVFKDIQSYLKKYKDINDKLKKLAQIVNSEQSPQEEFEIKFRNKILKTTFLFKAEYGFCVRITISDKEENYLDIEKIYIHLNDYIPLIQLMEKVIENYILLISNIPNIILLDEVKNNLNNLSEKMTNYYLEFKNNNGASSKEINIKPFPKENNQTELDKYVEDNINDIDLEIDKTEQKIQVVAKKAIVPLLQHDFTQKIISNDILKLERYIINLISHPLPLQAFSELVTTKSNNDLSFEELLFPGCSKKDLSLIFYINTILVKYYINKHLKNKESLPISIKPIIYDCKNPTEFNLSLMYDLFLYFIYYSQLRNILKEKTSNTIDNREMVCFALKTICSPLVFSFISSKIDKNIFIHEVIARYQKYCDTGVFSTLSQILSIDNISIPISIIEENTTKIYNGILKKREDLLIKNRILDLNKLGLTKLNYEDFTAQELSYEQIIKVVSLDFQNGQNNDTNDLPENISQKYKNIKKSNNNNDNKPTNENLIRFIQEYIDKEIKNDKKDISAISMEICNSIDTSYYDLEGKQFNYIILPETILKAIKIWDPIIDKKITKDYSYFKSQVKNSSLNKSMVINLLNNLNQRTDSDFINVLNIIN